jgi:hypothetical protein
MHASFSSNCSELEMAKKLEGEVKNFKGGKNAILIGLFNKTTI